MTPDEPSHLKPLSKDGIPSALEKAFRYRLLNEPLEAESICRDVLRVEADNQQALVTLLLAMTDRFSQGHVAGVLQAQEIVGRFRSEYDRHYYSGIILERRAKAHLGNAVPDAGHNAYEWLMEAMEFFEKAERVHPEGQEDARLRWNACARLIHRNKLGPRPVEPFEPALE